MKFKLTIQFLHLVPRPGTSPTGRADAVCSEPLGVECVVAEKDDVTALYYYHIMMGKTYKHLLVCRTSLARLEIGNDLLRCSVAAMVMIPDMPMLL